MTSAARISVASVHSCTALSCLFVDNSADLSPRRTPSTLKLARPGRLSAYGTTVFAEMSALAVTHGAINLGQGFPDTDGPEVLLETAVSAIRSGAHQYPPG